MDDIRPEKSDIPVDIQPERLNSSTQSTVPIPTGDDIHPQQKKKRARSESSQLKDSIPDFDQLLKSRRSKRTRVSKEEFRGYD